MVAMVAEVPNRVLKQAILNHKKKSINYQISVQSFEIWVRIFVVMPFLAS